MSTSSLSEQQRASLLEQCAALDTASLSDALDSLGIDAGLLGIIQQVPGTRCSGFAFTVLYEPVNQNDGFKNAANYIDEVPPGSVVVSSNAGRLDATVWGDILTHVAVQRNVRGTLIDGVARDIDTVTRLNYPLFSRGRFMQSGKNRVQLKATQVAVEVSGVTIHPGDLIVGDASGCLVIPIDKAEEVIKRAIAVEKTERDIIASVSQGLSLAEARRLHRYDQPWLAAEAKTPSAA
ncbi:MULTISPECIES: RraA family protein [Pseudomonas]|jgi:regulator of RNase E activity RraA|uniref:Putative 4-hydroxy-4-methyl-2-oxoglutarate aldolase n=4 Tax=Pseudomonas chlororaphis TaxID=587753 RepID=A0A0E1EBW5_9PSED|nr:MULTISPECIES: RraA family protein [Pseudomonas]AIC22670.1 dimethylmenaquinone methyltransferase [Pseudomonas chlororaphis]AIS10849.1 dimethylmenaquinone methyltransferase [Pseudomonas chlororaphis subsp. aurantiaca]AUG43390.1 S-adenosylmethionine--2-demethylmenaquinone methyltransferase [Pseudomonas chlororaphis]AZD24744.1 Demethylmenaquinone methyltransferase [Pseudomonas chlororaphis subsp. aurantiaca]AZD32053.1 Demethylmenaquinone methyltransferase [Pseudomonas chlororaphis]